MATHRIRIAHAYGKSLFESILPGCEYCIEKPGDARCHLSSENRRKIHISNDKIAVSICSNSPIDIKNPQVLKSKAELMLLITPDVCDNAEKAIEEEKKKLKRLFHNVTSLNGHNIQELYAVVPQGSLLTAREQKRVIETRFKQVPREASEAFLRLAKNCAEIKTEIDVFQKIHLGNHIPSPGRHRVHSLLMTVLYVFFTDFANNSIYIDVETTEQNIFVDFDSIRIALYHFFQNAEKYCLPERNISISFQTSNHFCAIKIEMISLQITETDRHQLFQEGYSGELSYLLGKNGHGLGMGIIQDMLNLNNGRIEIDSDITAPIVYGDLLYVKNVFTIILPTRKQEWESST